MFDGKLWAGLRTKVFIRIFGFNEDVYQVVSTNCVCTKILMCFQLAQ